MAFNKSTKDTVFHEKYQVFCIMEKLAFYRGRVYNYIHAAISGVFL